MMLALTIGRRVLIVLALWFVLFPIRFGEQPATTQAADIEVLVVVDRTRSMAALDYENGAPRWEGVQEDLNALVESLPGARFGLITFGAESQTELPFTTDAAAFTTAIETIPLEPIYYGKGSRADRPLPDIVELLERAEENHPDRRRMIVFVGDGENTADGEQKSFAEVKDLVAGGAVLGYGTEEGARMPEADDLSGDEGYVYDYETYEDAISHADLANLETVAEQIGVDYEHRTEPGGIEDVAAGFEAEYTPEEDEERPAKHDLTWVAGLALTLLLLWELYPAWHAVWNSNRTLRARPETRPAKGVGR